MNELPGNTVDRHCKILSVFGFSAEAAAKRLEGIERKFPGVQLDVEYDEPIAFARIYTGGSSGAMADAIRWAFERLGHGVFSDSGKTMEQVVGELLVDQHATLALAESCTGGLIASLLTDVPGSSDYFLFSAVTYSNQAKIKILDVKPETLDHYGAVSKHTAIEMAEGVRLIAEAGYGLATSGIAGPAGATDGKPVGTVCIGLASKSEATGHRFHIDARDRRTNKRIFAITALDLLRRKLLKD